MPASSLLALIDDIASVLDDVALLTKAATKKTAGVLGDDLALNAQQVSGVRADRELPVVWAVAKGSLVNKAILVPAALAISALVPRAVTPLLMIGGLFLCYEGFEKLAHKFFHKAEEDAHKKALEVAVANPAIDLLAFEKDKVKGAIRTDFILSAEIMVIALNEVVDSQPDAGFLMRAVILAVVAVLITVLVYGVVALIVKMDDIGLRLAQREGPRAQRIGHALVGAMPRLLAVISLVGTAAMLWVGGHILLASLDELGFHAPYGLVHDWEVVIHDAVGGWFGSLLGWLTNTVASAVVGLVVGAVVVAVMHVLPFGKHQKSEDHESAEH